MKFSFNDAKAARARWEELQRNRSSGADAEHSCTAEYDHDEGPDYGHQYDYYRAEYAHAYDDDGYDEDGYVHADPDVWRHDPYFSPEEYYFDDEVWRVAEEVRRTPPTWDTVTHPPLYSDDPEHVEIEEYLEQEEREYWAVKGDSHLLTYVDLQEDAALRALAKRRSPRLSMEPLVPDKIAPVQAHPECFRSIRNALFQHRNNPAQGYAAEWAFASRFFGSDLRNLYSTNWWVCVSADGDLHFYRLAGHPADISPADRTVFAALSGYRIGSVVPRSAGGLAFSHVRSPYAPPRDLAEVLGELRGSGTSIPRVPVEPEILDGTAVATWNYLVTNPSHLPTALYRRYLSDGYLAPAYDGQVFDIDGFVIVDGRPVVVEVTCQWARARKNTGGARFGRRHVDMLRRLARETGLPVVFILLQYDSPHPVPQVKILEDGREGNWYGLVLDPAIKADERARHYLFRQEQFTEISGPAGDLAALMDFLSRAVAHG